jgi:hypothetical protein
MKCHYRPDYSSSRLDLAKGDDDDDGGGDGGGGSLVDDHNDDGPSHIAYSIATTSIVLNIYSKSL